jgi:hypothetical protein
MRRFPPAFYRTAAIASLVSAVTTLLLIFLPDFYSASTGFEGRMRRVDEPAYVLRSWVYLIHPMLALAAAFAVALRLRRHAALLLPGAVGFALWAATEMAQQAMTLFMFDRWRRAWLTGDDAVRAGMEVRTVIYDGLWDSSYVLLLIGFLIGCAFYAAAMLRLEGLSRLVGAFYAAAALLTACLLIAEFGGPPLPSPLDRWLYPAIQPLGRLLIGLWLWKNADESAPIGLPRQAKASQ